jgi:hypothetical protein
MKLNYISKSSGIKGYDNSSIAKSEKNDCVVRAIASASGWEYNKAHYFVSKWFNRQPKKGTYFFNIGMTKIENTGKRLNRKKVTTISKGEMKNGKSKMTIGAFASLYNKGSYIVTVKGHAFTIKDGSVIGNIDDAVKTRKILKGAWKVGS